VSDKGIEELQQKLDRWKADHSKGRNDIKKFSYRLRMTIKRNGQLKKNLKKINHMISSLKAELNSSQSQLDAEKEKEKLLYKLNELKKPNK